MRFISDEAEERREVRLHFGDLFGAKKIVYSIF